MIGRLRGQLISKKPPQLCIEVAGVGYDVECPMSTFYALPKSDKETILLTHLAIRDDAHVLYGFATEVERILFRALLKVNGVGAKMALAILSGMNPSEFGTCIANADTATLVRIPGVGKKTAERLIIEMKDRLDALSLTTATPSSSPQLNQIHTPMDAKTEAIEALQALGYKPAQASQMVNRVAQPDMNSETLIRQALKALK